MKVPVGLIDPNPKQPRTEFDPAELEKLAQSMQDHGLLNPISVEENGERYTLIGRHEGEMSIARNALVQEVIKGLPVHRMLR